ncbi:baseplate J/gp47 family protein [Bartonella sp. AR 15-3]|uniref:baseplate J/gp47 family protein n=1 Tax=Bartonella sp. AR 15-3 TaxID=545617 RepID=UPI0001F4C688|nr:baseplate J/gp47 family protein [Bartonella sp. AR 15-3]OPB31385.1 Phage-related baseplate assembly protein [Bartonella sp. AR 15-3]CBI79577.1 Phage-related baseplate assembly protein [Bartonella sp. AR 15-3]
MKNLSNLEIISELSFEEIRAANIEHLKELLPRYILLESDPAVKVIEAFSYRELLLRQRINEAARNNILDFATGESLDALGNWHGIARMEDESDERYRERIRLHARGGKTSGTEPYYKLIAMSADNRVKDAIIYRKGKDPTIYVALFGKNEEGTASEDLIQTVSQALHRKNIIMTNDTIIVHAAVKKVVDLEADVWLLPETSLKILMQMEENLRAAWKKEQAIGRELSLSWWISKLMIAGVQKVSAIAPTQDSAVCDEEVLAIGKITLNFKGRAR